VRLHDALYPDQWLDLCVQPVAHELELAIWRNEADGPVVFESTQPYALMELDIFHLDGLASCCSTRCLKHDFIVEAETKLGHT